MRMRQVQLLISKELQEAWPPTCGPSTPNIYIEYIYIECSIILYHFLFIFMIFLHF